MTPSDLPRATILVVDDTPMNLSVLTHLFKDLYRVKVASNGAKALALAFAAPPDLILLDIMMPDMDGFEVCRRLKADPATRHIPVIFLTARTDIAAEEEGFAAGAVDFVHKPISPPIVAARVKTHLDIQSWQAFLQDRNAWLQQQVEQRLSEINHLQDAAIYVMVSLAECRDETTGNHIRRTQEYVRLLGIELARLPQYRQRLTPGAIEHMSKSAPLHDIGKIAIPDEILLKPGKLSSAEFTIMKTHSRCGYDMLVKASALMGERGQFLDVAMEIALSHHEKWDGSGYPEALAGHAIPLSARLMALADVFDALRSRRPYKLPMSSDETSAIIVAGRGLHFDPDVVDAYLAIRPEFERVAAEWADHA